MKKTIADFEIKNKRVIIRCDLNVPMKAGKVTDDNRIKESLPTIRYAVSKKAKVIIMSHLGRVQSKEDKTKKDLSPVCERLSDLLGQPVYFASETRGRVLEDKINSLKPGEVLLMQNTRYEDYPDKKESSNDEELGKYWASLGDVFINDAFGTSHRRHASNVGIASNLPSGIGFLVEKEIKMLRSVLDNPERPYVVIMGGAKMSDKIKVIDKLIKTADYVLLGGGIANTFLKAQGLDLKASIYDEESVSHCKELLRAYGDKIILPVDGYSTSAYQDGLSVNYSSVENIPDGMMMLDVGDKTINHFKPYLLSAKTVFWNGPVGVSEFRNFEYGTKQICQILKESGANVVVGGGDSAAAAISFGYGNAFAHVSTGGGASLEFIEGKSLPGIEVIENK